LKKVISIAVLLISVAGYAQDSIPVFPLVKNPDRKLKIAVTGGGSFHIPRTYALQALPTEADVANHAKKIEACQGLEGGLGLEYNKIVGIRALYLAYVISFDQKEFEQLMAKYWAGYDFQLGSYKNGNSSPTGTQLKLLSLQAYGNFNIGNFSIAPMAGVNLGKVRLPEYMFARRLKGTNSFYTEIYTTKPASCTLYSGGLDVRYNFKTGDERLKGTLIYASVFSKYTTGNVRGEYAISIQDPLGDSWSGSEILKTRESFFTLGLNVGVLF
jgi:hypothetical protein